MPKILLAEDDTDMRRFLVKALQNAGYDVISYDNGLSAYQRLRDSLPSKAQLSLIKYDAINDRVIYSRQELQRIWNSP